MGAPRPLSSGSTPDFTALRQHHPTIWVGGVDLLTDPTADGSLPVGQGVDVCVNAWINGVAHGESRQLRQASSPGLQSFREMRFGEPGLASIGAMRQSCRSRSTITWVDGSPVRRACARYSCHGIRRGTGEPNPGDRSG